MDKQRMYYALPCFGNKVSGTVHALYQLSARFQIYCRTCGLTDEESLSVLTYGDKQEEKLYFGSSEKCKNLALNSYSKIVWPDVDHSLDLDDEKLSKLWE